jgi:amino acid permease
LVKFSVGAGVMALPWATMQGGVASAPCLVLLAVWNGYTAWLLLDCAPAGSFSDVARMALGRPGVAALESALLVVLMGVRLAL